jgi:hypothetical protein
VDRHEARPEVRREVEHEREELRQDRQAPAEDEADRREARQHRGEGGDELPGGTRELQDRGGERCADVADDRVRQSGDRVEDRERN